MNPPSWNKVNPPSWNRVNPPSWNKANPPSGGGEAYSLYSHPAAVCSPHRASLAASRPTVRLCDWLTLPTVLPAGAARAGAREHRLAAVHRAGEPRPAHLRRVPPAGAAAAPVRADDVGARAGGQPAPAPGADAGG
eukprot:8931739-Pyramimonas_sp.AAC.1